MQSVPSDAFKNQPVLRFWVLQVWGLEVEGINSESKPLEGAKELS